MPSKSPGSAAACPFSSNLSAFVLNNTLNAIKTLQLPVSLG